MEYRYSTIIEPTEESRIFLGDGIFPRVADNHRIAGIALIKARNDWHGNLDVSNLDNHTAIGAIHPVYGGASALSWPECLPDRTAIVANVLEFTGIFDDATEAAGDSKTAKALKKTFGKALQMRLRKDAINGQPPTREAEFMSNMFRTFMDIDPTRASRTFKVMAESLDTTFQTKTPEDNLEEFLAWRLVYNSLIIYGCGIEISDQEEQLLTHLSQDAWRAAGFYNDYFSLDKELRDAEKRGMKFDEIWNVIPVLMRERSIGLDGAKHVNWCAGTSGESTSNSTSPPYKRPKKVTHTRAASCVVCSSFLTLSNGRHHVNHTKDDSLQVQNGTNGTNNGHQNAGVAKPVESTATAPLDDSVRVKKLFGDSTVGPVSDDVIMGPWKYISQSTGKGVRDKLFDALKAWYEVPDTSVTILKKSIELIHHSSLMLDDIEDGSPLRRGKPSAHTVFGIPQTVNACNFMMTKAVEMLGDLGSKYQQIVLAEMNEAFIGQSLDVHWTSNLVCPTIEEYINVLDRKSGSLICVVDKLMRAASPLPSKPKTCHCLVVLFGRFYALRDDYVNLVSAEYTKIKGFCEDLDEGKFSILIIHAFNSLPPDQALPLRNMLIKRRVDGCSTLEKKQLILDMLEQGGRFAYTLDLLRDLQDELAHALELVEEETNVQNPAFRAVIDGLRV
ncbi:Isoprenoid synthase domain containing protein [Rhypophila sp. PSN 637]